MMFSPVGTLRPSGQSDEEKFYVSILEPYFGIDSRVLFLGLFLKYCGLSQDLQSYEYSRLFVITSFHNECSTSLVRGIRELRLDWNHMNIRVLVWFAWLSVSSSEFVITYSIWIIANIPTKIYLHQHPVVIPHIQLELLQIYPQNIHELPCATLPNQQTTGPFLFFCVEQLCILIQFWVECQTLNNKQPPTSNLHYSSLPTWLAKHN